jgi:uncharacterized membrane protein
MLYSIAGWVMETLLYLIRDKKVVKRGFLFGPVCPIYGCGALLCTLLIYGRIHNIFLVFLAGTLLCGLLEYITHFLMEKLFHAMWWDYSNRRFNINGRVYLNGLLIFGAGATLIVKVLQPLVFRLIGVMPDSVLYWICFILYSILIVDVGTTVADLKGTVTLLRNMQATIISSTQKGVDLTSEQINNLTEEFRETELFKLLKDNPMLAKFRKRYPTFTLKKYKYILDIIADNPVENKGRKDLKLYGTAETVPVAEKTDEKTINNKSE